MNQAVGDYKDLVAWQRAMDVGLQVYKATESFPSSEKYGLTSQLRRASVSVASNIAEGYGRGSTRDYLRFLRAARGSLYEVETQLLFAQQLEFVSSQACEQLRSRLKDVARVLAGLIRSVGKGAD